MCPRPAPALFARRAGLERFHKPRQRLADISYIAGGTSLVSTFPPTTDRRTAGRLSTAFPVAVCDRNGRLLAKGRSANVSAQGLFVVASARHNLQTRTRVRVFLRVPDASDRAGRRKRTRPAEYVCRVARVQQLGDLVGLGLEFVKKVR